MSTREYVSTKEQAAWIRAAVRETFPACKISVRKASGGAVYVTWTDGPTVKQIQEVTRRFELEGFDGMTDMRYGIPLEVDGRAVYGGGLILHQRDISDEWRDEIIAEFETLCEREIPDPDVRGSGYWEMRIPVHVSRLEDGEVYRMVDTDTEYVSELVHRYTTARARA